MKKKVLIQRPAHFQLELTRLNYTLKGSVISHFKVFDAVKQFPFNLLCNSHVNSLNIHVTSEIAIKWLKITGPSSKYSFSRDF